MPNASRRSWRLFYLALGVTVSVFAAAQAPVLTTVNDTVFRANGDPAAGTVLISWPAFTTADNYSVAAGNLSVVLAPDGAFNAELAPNAGATPAGTVYTVVYQLTDGTVKTERWSVGATSPETIAQVRIFTVPPAGQSQFATQQYVDSALANVVHLSGTETITGSKQFTLSPIVPTPSEPSHAANKSYVDAGNAGKADLVSGLVPTGELGTGSANSSACLHGDSSWGGCGTGSGSGLTPGMQAIKYATDFSWSQNPSADLSAPGAKTVTLAPCPAGVSGSEPQYYVYVSGSGTSEAVLVTGGTCAGNGLGGTLQFTSANPHPGGYSVGSASGGLQEALIAARFTPSNPSGSSQSGKVIVPPGELKAFARVSIRASNITVDFSGSIVECWMNDTCLYIGDAANSNLFEDITLLNPRGRPTIAGGQMPFIEVELTYTAGFDLIPDAIKYACAQIVRNAQSAPALNVKAGRVDRMRMDYFAPDLLDTSVRALLAPYVAQKAG
jgi:hypothetical protein